MERPVRMINLASFKVISWNMQGGADDATKSTQIRKWIGDKNVHVILLQECGALFGWGANDFAGEGWQVLRQDWTGPQNGNNRCSLAVLVRGGAKAYHVTDAVKDSHRPLIGAQHHSGFWFFSAHCPASGNAAPYRQAALESSLVWSGGHPMLCAGDFNAAPQPFQGFQLCNTGGKTHMRGNELDYGYCHKIECSATAICLNVGASDHAAIEFTFVG